MKLFLTTTILLIIILGLSYYNYTSHGEEYRNELKKDRIWKISGVTVREINPYCFTANNYHYNVIVCNYQNKIENSDSLKVGDLTSVRGIHIKGDTLTAELIHIHKGRIWKVYLSLIPFFIISFLFFKYFKFDLTTRRIVKK